MICEVGGFCHRVTLPSPIKRRLAFSLKCSQQLRLISEPVGLVLTAQVEGLGDLPSMEFDPVRGVRQYDSRYPVFASCQAPDDAR